VRRGHAKAAEIWKPTDNTCETYHVERAERRIGDSGIAALNFASTLCCARSSVERVFGNVAFSKLQTSQPGKHMPNVSFTHNDPFSHRLETNP
jgi:hypothetical protein